MIRGNFVVHFDFYCKIYMVHFTITFWFYDIAKILEGKKIVLVITKRQQILYYVTITLICFAYLMQQTIPLYLIFNYLNNFYKCMTIPLYVISSFQHFWIIFIFYKF